VNSGLTWFANAWLCMAVVVNALVVASAFATALSFSDGIRQLQDAYDPFDPENWIFQLALFAPAAIAIFWRDRRQARPTH
jgi:hypothetical protein